MTNERIEQLIKECQLEADKSIATGNPPFGCVITDADGVIVVRANNTQFSDSDPTAHAEIRAMRLLGKQLGSPYLDGYHMFANAASCAMCMSGGVKAHITKFYYGAPPEGAMTPWITMEDIAAKCTTPIEIFGPILAQECAEQIANGRAALVRR